MANIRDLLTKGGAHGLPRSLDGLLDVIQDHEDALLAGGGDVTSVFGRTGDVVAQAGDVAAAIVNIADAGAYFATDNTEAALQQVGAFLASLALTSNGNGASLVGIEDAGGFFTGANAEAALQEAGAITSATNPGANELGSFGTGVAYSSELVPLRRARLVLTNVDVSIDAADDFGSFQLATLAPGVILLHSSRVNLTVTDESGGNLGTLDDIDIAVGTAAVAANDMSTPGSQSILGIVNADAGGNFAEIQLPTASVGFSNPVFLNMTQMVSANATARFNGSIEILYADLKATGDA